jgi:two-component system, cell cycle sensor histidine kinase and response regulator CckA
MDQAADVIDISAIARAQQLRNTRGVSLTLALLSTAGAVVAWFAGYSALMVFVVLGPAFGMGFAFVLARKGYLGPAVFLLVASIFIQHPMTVAMQGALGATPFAASVVLFLATATSPSRYLGFAFVGCLLTLGLEGALVPLTPADQGLLATAALLASLSFVVSLLHARGVERAFALAEEQSRARAASAREALESERRFRLLAESADDLIAILRPNGETAFMSDSHERLFGIPLATLSQGRFSDHLHVEELEQVRATFARCLADGYGRFEFVVIVPGKGRVLLDVRMRPIEWQSQVLVAMVSRDITEQRTLQDRLHTSERLEALGRLAGSVAHDFNNLLTVVEGSAEIASSKLPSDSEVHEDLQAVLSASHMGAELAKQLLTFSRREVVVRTPTDLAAVLNEQANMLTRIVGSSVRLEFELPAQLPKVSIPKAHVEQLAMNFAANARDAMPRGGALSMVLRERHLYDRQISDLLGGLYIEFEVKDTGAGIPTEILPRVFEPFFSTKGRQGTGLGLATCHSIAVAAGGTITVSSVVGQGTSFSVFLPVTQQTEARDTAPGVGAALALKHVLVVDDDQDVRNLVTRMLSADGFDVQSVPSAKDALAILEDPSVVLDALVTDVVLGNDRGTDLLVQCRALRPSLRILVVSGYAPDPKAALVLEQSGAAFLAKPFGRDKLRAALLDRS